MQQQAMATDQRRHTEMTKADALRAINQGEFSYCHECGDAIDAARLDHDPALTLCFPCAKAL